MSAQIVEKSWRKTVRKSSMRSLATINCPCKSIVVVVLNVVGKVHPRFHRYLARISIQTSAKLQCEQGALFSYREAEQNLEKLNCQRRSVNNHTQVKRITDKVGLCWNRTLFQRQHRNMPAAELIIQVDGGHIPFKTQKTQFWSLVSHCVSTWKSSCSGPTPSPNH